jgi:hypothetical protein
MFEAEVGSHYIRGGGPLRVSPFNTLGEFFVRNKLSSLLGCIIW